MRNAIPVLLALVLCSCSTDRTPDNNAGEGWEARLVSQEGSTIEGTAEAQSGEGRTSITVRIEGASPGGTYPWHLHRGDCGSGGGIVGDANAYSPLQPGNDGQATATATINMDLGEEGEDDYHVNVHASTQDMGTIVACGELDDD